MGLRIDTSNDTYHWAISDYWYNNPVHITIYNDDATPVKLGGIKLQMISCNAGGHSVTTVPTGQAGGQSGKFALYEYNAWTRISQVVTVAAESRSNLCTSDSSEPFDNTQTWFIPRYTKYQGAQYNQYSDDGNYISQQDYNNAFYTFKLSSPLVIPANSYAQVTLRLEDSGGTWQLSDLVNATPLPSYQITYNPNGGNWSGSTSSVVHEVVQGENDSLPPNPTRSGYNFTGWSPSGAPPTTVQQNYTYTAQWQPATSTVTFYRNSTAADAQNNSGTGQIGAQVGSDADTISNDISINNTTYHNRLRELVEANIAQDEAVGGACNGYQFWHWRSDRVYTKIRSSESPSYINISQKNIQANSDDNKFYAVWKAKSGDVHFYQNYDVTDTQEVPGSPVTGVDYILDRLGDKKPTDPTRVGYRFLGWSLSRDGDTVSDDTVLWDTATGQARDCFYVIWEKIYTIWVRENGVWVKKLNVREYKAAQNTWDEKPPKERSSGSWVDKS